MRVLVAAAFLALAATGCSSDGGEAERDDGPTPPTSSPSGRLVSQTEACAEVRAGIDSFNEGDLEETVEHFEKARPLAAQLVEDGEDAKPLLEAIEYYAALAPDEYPSASPSPEFQRNKAITLTICEYGAGQPVEPTETGVPA